MNEVLLHSTWFILSIHLTIAGTQMSNDSLFSAARASLDAYKSKKWDAIRVSVTDDCVYDETATHRKVEGIAAILEVWQGWAAAMPDSRATF